MHFSVVLYSGTLATASGYASLTPLPGTNNLSVPVSRIRTAGETGSLILDITFSDPGGLSSVSPDLYRVVSGGLEPYPWVQGSEPWTWDSISGSFSLNWGNIPSGTYLLSVSAYVAGLGSRIALGDDALVEIYDGCVSGTVSGAPISYNTEQLYSSAVRYYVSSNGGEASSGVLPNAPVLFETAVTYARDNPLATQARPARIILLDSIVLGNTVYLMSPMVVSGLTGTEKISLGMNMETSLFVVGNQISPITVALENVEVAAESGGVVYSAMNGLVSINYGVLELRPGSVITGNQGVVGGINLQDSSAALKMLGEMLQTVLLLNPMEAGSANAGGLSNRVPSGLFIVFRGGIWLSSGAILELSELRRFRSREIVHPLPEAPSLPTRRRRNDITPWLCWKRSATRRIPRLCFPKVAAYNIHEGRISARSCFRRNSVLYQHRNDDVVSFRPCRQRPGCSIALRTARCGTGSRIRPSG